MKRAESVGGLGLQYRVAGAKYAPQRVQWHELNHEGDDGTARQLLSGGTPSARLTDIVEPWFLGAGAGAQERGLRGLPFWRRGTRRAIQQQS